MPNQTGVFWCSRSGLNCRPPPYQGGAAIPFLSFVLSTYCLRGFSMRQICAQIIHGSNQIATVFGNVMRVPDDGADIEPSALFHSGPRVFSQQPGCQQMAKPMLRHATYQGCIGRCLVADGVSNVGAAGRAQTPFLTLRAVHNGAFGAALCSIECRLVLPAAVPSIVGIGLTAEGQKEGRLPIVQVTPPFHVFFQNGNGRWEEASRCPEPLRSRSWLACSHNQVFSRRPRIAVSHSDASRVWFFAGRR